MTELALSPLATLSRRRFQLTARTPRELLVPLLTPIMFALVIAPALKTALHTQASYESYVAIGTIGLLIPLNTMFAGLGVIVDRESGAQRELLAAPVPRALIVLGNMLVALAITGLQVGVLIAVAVARGIHFHASATGVGWFLGVAVLFTVGMYGAAEILANRCRSRRSTSHASPRSRFFPGSSPVHSSPSAPCRTGSPGWRSSCRSRTPLRSCATACSVTAAGCTTSGGCPAGQGWRCSASASSPSSRSCSAWPRSGSSPGPRSADGAVGESRSG